MKKVIVLQLQDEGDVDLVAHAFGCLLALQLNEPGHAAAAATAALEVDPRDERSGRIMGQLRTFKASYERDRGN